MKSILLLIIIFKCSLVFALGTNQKDTSLDLEYQLCSVLKIKPQSIEMTEIGGDLSEKSNPLNFNIKGDKGLRVTTSSDAIVKCGVKIFDRNINPEDLNKLIYNNLFVFGNFNKSSKVSGSPFFCINNKSIKKIKGFGLFFDVWIDKKALRGDKRYGFSSDYSIDRDPKEKINLFVNGLGGRIGQLIFRYCLYNDKFNITQATFKDDMFGGSHETHRKYLEELFFDDAQGPLENNLIKDLIYFDGGDINEFLIFNTKKECVFRIAIKKNGKRLRIFRKEKQEKLVADMLLIKRAYDTKDVNIENINGFIPDAIVDATGKNKTIKKMEGFLIRGTYKKIAGKPIVLATYPLRDGKDCTYLPSVNNPKAYDIGSVGSCTTNGLAAISKAFFGVLPTLSTVPVKVTNLYANSVHAMTNSEYPLKTGGLRNTPTGAQKVFNWLGFDINNVDVECIRTNNLTGSFLECYFNVEGIEIKDCKFLKTVINKSLKSLANTSLKGLITVTEDVNTSKECIRNKGVAVINPKFTKVSLNGKNVIIRLGGFYDNEDGYTKQVMRYIADVMALHREQEFKNYKYNIIKDEYLTLHPLDPRTKDINDCEKYVLRSA